MPWWWWWSRAVFTIVSVVAGTRLAELLDHTDEASGDGGGGGGLGASTSS